MLHGLPVESTLQLVERGLLSSIQTVKAAAQRLACTAYDKNPAMVMTWCMCNSQTVLQTLQDVMGESLQSKSHTPPETHSKEEKVVTEQRQLQSWPIASSGLGAVGSGAVGGARGVLQMTRARTETEPGGPRTGRRAVPAPDRAVRPQKPQPSNETAPPQVTGASGGEKKPSIFERLFKSSKKKDKGAEPPAVKSLPKDEVAQQQMDPSVPVGGGTGLLRSRRSHQNRPPLGSLSAAAEPQQPSAVLSNSRLSGGLVSNLSPLNLKGARQATHGRRADPQATLRQKSLDNAVELDEEQPWRKPGMMGDPGFSSFGGLFSPKGMFKSQQTTA
jgi:hypothetical protein